MLQLITNMLSVTDPGKDGEALHLCADKVRTAADMHLVMALLLCLCAFSLFRKIDLCHVKQTR